MAITLKQFDGATVTPTDDAILNHLMMGTSGIIEGCEPTWLGTNQIKVSAGRGIAMGRQFTVDEETVTVTLTGGAAGRLLIEIDIGNATPGTFVSQAAATLPSLEQGDLNHGDTVYQLPVCLYNVGALTISNMTDARTIIAGAGVINHSAEKITSGTLPIARGGTGGATAAAARSSLAIPRIGTVEHGGTLSSIDTLTESGLYKVNGYGGSVGLPTGEFSGLLEHIYYDANFAAQRLFCDSEIVYERIKAGGEWGNFLNYGKKIALSVTTSGTSSGTISAYSYNGFIYIKGNSVKLSSALSANAEIKIATISGAAMQAGVFGSGRTLVQPAEAFAIEARNSLDVYLKDLGDGGIATSQYIEFSLITPILS